MFLRFKSLGTRIVFASVLVVLIPLFVSTYSVPGKTASVDPQVVEVAENQGTAADNNVWREGRLDAFAALDLSRRRPTGILQGTVTDSITNLPIARALIVAEGPSNRTTMTNSSGQYRIRLPVGSYQLTASALGYSDQIFTAVDILKNQTTTQNFFLDPE